MFSQNAEKEWLFQNFALVIKTRLVMLYNKPTKRKWPPQGGTSILVLHGCSFIYFLYWLNGCFGFNGPLKQYFSLYRAVFQREGDIGEKG